MARVWAYIDDLIEKAEADIGAADMLNGRRLQGGGMPNTQNPYRKQKMRGGSYYVNPYPGEPLRQPDPNNFEDF